MTKVAHLILAHRSPKQVSRLIHALTYPLHDVYVHVDKKKDLAPFRELINEPNTYIIANRKRVDWGAYNMVEATLSSMSEILKRGHYDFINLLSGADYPLVKPEAVDLFLDGHLQKSFMEFQHQGSPWWEEAKGRTEKVHLTNYRFTGRHFLQGLINIFPFKRKPPGGLELVGRSQWFTIATAHAAYVLHYVEKYPEIVRFFKHSWGPDEFFFQTILYNSPFNDALINNNLRYIDWSEGNTSPRELTLDDYEPLKKSGKFYARKFKHLTDSEILTHIDLHLLNQT